MRTFFSSLVDLLYPPTCLYCGEVLEKEMPPFCWHCLSQISFITSPCCPYCGYPYTESDEIDHPCGDCLINPPSFTLARSLGRYEGILMEVIHRFKYGRKRSIGVALGKMMALSSYPSFNIDKYDLVMPVPLHVKRLKSRTFNQALILAREIARHFSLSLDCLTLRRRLNTESQVGLSSKQREQNVKGAFVVTNAANIKGRRILLVDDVYTTGSTVMECARVLKRWGAQEVAILTVARASS